MSRPIFVRNFEYETSQSELERLFSKYGRVERVDMKSGTSTKGNCAFIWLANSAKKLLMQWKLSCLPACSPSIHRWHHPAFSSHDHLSPTNLTAKVFIPQEWSWWGSCHAYYYSLLGDEWILYAIPSISELVLSERRSMLSNDASDLKIWTLNL